MNIIDALIPKMHFLNYKFRSIKIEACRGYEIPERGLWNPQMSCTLEVDLLLLDINTY